MKPYVALAVIVFAVAFTGVFAFGAEIGEMDFFDGRFSVQSFQNDFLEKFAGFDRAGEQMPGWPKTVSIDLNFTDSCGLVIADIDDDPDLEIIAATSAEELHVWDPDGTLIFTHELTGLAQTIAAVGDVIGDDAPEIVVGTRDMSGSNPMPGLYVFSGDGALLTSGQLGHEGAMSQPVTLADVAGDEKLEIIVGEAGSQTGWLYVLNGDLSEAPGDWPAQLDHVPATSAAVGDIDGDGDDEIAVCSFYSLYAFEADGLSMSQFPVQFDGETYSYGSPALADFNDDGKLEIVSVTHGDHSRVHCTQYDGSELDGWPYELGSWSYSNPAVGDIDGDGSLEVVVGRAGGTIEDENLFVLTAGGKDFGNFPYTMAGGAEGNFVVADWTGDSDLEIIFTNNIADGGQGYLFAVDSNADLLDGWPLRPEGMTYLNGATLADVNDDGAPELGVFANGSDGTAKVHLYTFDDYAFGPGGVHWRTYQADNRHTGLYNPDAGDDDDADDDVDDDANDDVDDDFDDDVNDDADDDSDDDAANGDADDDVDHSDDDDDDDDGGSCSLF